jgi:hypothetical protein
MSGSPLPKHVRYIDQHIPGELYWGIGIENETYLELPGGIRKPAEFLAKHQVRERYSVNYWTQYKYDRIRSVLEKWIQSLPQGSNTEIHLPFLVNGHTFTKCDVWGEHRTTYSVTPAPNPKFTGTTWMDVMEISNPDVFGPAARDVWWCFDGDTVEFMTQRFRCGSLEDTLEELHEYKDRWLRALQDVLLSVRCEIAWAEGVQWPLRNYGFAVFLSNRQNVAIFNNGTYHVNLTAPTRLDKNGEIEDWSKFLHIHRNAARLFQWISPFLVAALGSADPFANLGGPHKEFPAGSQRLAASRFVSVGTYDTCRMPSGKLLTTPTKEMDLPPLWWHEMYASKQSAFEKLEAIGYDINFNKFKNHGLEFRIFDWFPEEDLGPLVRTLIGMMDIAMSIQSEIPVPQESRIWRRVLGRCVWEGANALLTEREQRIFASVLQIPKVVGITESVGIFNQIQYEWSKQWGSCSKVMCKVPPPQHIPLNPIEPPLHRMEESMPSYMSVPIILIQKIRINETLEIHPRHIQSPAPPPQTPCTRTVPVVSSSGWCLPLRRFLERRKTMPSKPASWGLI